MKRLTLIAGIAVLCVPAMSHAEFGLRLGLENPIYTHVDTGGRSGWFSIGDTWQPAINALLEYYPIGNIGVGLEFREGFAATGSSSGVLGTGYQRTGTFLGPNVTFDAQPLPLFVRAALPIHLEPDVRYMNLRLAGGLKIGIPLASLYLEATADLPLFGDNVTAFSSPTQFGVGAGLWFKF
jgi:hypothetical protein